MDLVDLMERIREDPNFVHLRTEGVNLVPGEGVEDCEVMVVGEAPGAVENLRRRPFVGPSGRVLRQLMATAGLSVDTNTWLTNTVKFRPPGNRTPSIREILDSKEHLRNEWSLVGKPAVIVACGSVAWDAVGGTRSVMQSLSRSVGQAWGVGACWIWAMYHPAYAMRNPGIRGQVEAHWTELGKWLEERNGT